MADDARALNLPPYKGAVAAPYDTPEFRSALRNIRTWMSGTAAAVLHDGRNKIVAGRIPGGSGLAVDAVVKDFRIQGVQKLKSLVQASKAAKAWRGAFSLQDRGFATPAPIAYLERRRRGFVAECIFIAARVSDAREIRDLFRIRGDPDLRALLSPLAVLLRRFHDAGLVHRDLSDGNIFVRDNAGGGFEFLFLDTNRIRLRRRVGAFRRARNLVRLGIPSGLRPFFLEQYAAAPGLFRIGRSFGHWYHWGKRMFAGRLRFKKALRLRKIARILKIQ